MMDWFIGNISTIVVSIIILGLVLLVIRKLVMDKKKASHPVAHPAQAALWWEAVAENRVK